MFVLRKQFAQMIIKEVGPVIPYDINIMNERGTILASTNSNRINRFHEAAFKIITEKLNELNVVFDGEYEGCRKGINFPILFENEIIGVIGMTGDVDEVSKYGQILKKMTEVMTRDMFLENKRNLREREKDLFLYDLLRGRADASSLKHQLADFGLQSEGPFRVFTFNPSNASENKIFPRTISYTLQGHGVGLSNEPLAVLKRVFYPVTIKSKETSFYIGCSCNSVADIPKSYRTAKLLRSYLSAKSAGQIESYDEHFVDILIWQAGDDVKQQYLNKLFRKTDKRSVEDMIELINIYEECDGSITAIAEEMHLHKNTVQYRINKVREITGLDIRKYRDFFYLKAAAIMFQ